MGKSKMDVRWLSFLILILVDKDTMSDTKVGQKVLDSIVRIFKPNTCFFIRKPSIRK